MRCFERHSTPTGDTLIGSVTISTRTDSLGYVCLKARRVIRQSAIEELQSVSIVTVLFSVP